jgi:parallel beta-helix repeat protein
MSRRRWPLALALVLAAAGRPGTAGATAPDPVREALSRAWDRAGKAAGEERPRPGEGRILVREEAGTRVLIVRASASWTDLRRAAPSDVREVRDGVWELDRSIWVVGGARLRIESPQVRELRLVSRGRSFATIGALAGDLSIHGERSRKLLIRSWVPGGGPDRVLGDGRGSLSVRRGGRFDAVDVSFRDLGFYNGRVSGVAVTAPQRGPRSTGRFWRSEFIRNYFGAYSYEARDIVWAENRFIDNVVYGLDPHDGSNRFIVKRNIAAGNGRHGIIFSRRCNDNTIRDNVSVGNGWNGIVLDDGKLGDGPSNRNRVLGNVVRDNGRVGISVEGSSHNVIGSNQVSGQPIGIRLFGRALGNAVAANNVRNAGSAAIVVTAPAQANAIFDNLVRGGPTGVRIRGAKSTTVRANMLLDLRAHAVSIEGGARDAAADVVIDRNTITGAGRSPLHFEGGDRVRVRRNDVAWDYPSEHDLARVLAWGVGPGIWLLILGAATLGSLAAARDGTARRRRRRAALAGVAGLAVAAAAVVIVTGRGGGGARPAMDAGLPRAPDDPREGRARPAARGPQVLALRVVSKQGHPTHPTWYHDSQVALAGREVIVAWNGDREVRAARLRASDLEIVEKQTINDAALGGSRDSTGTDTDRHDTPVVLSDTAGRVHFLYGGGSIAGRSNGDGPYHRATTRAGDLASLSPERALDIGGGAAFDFEAVTGSSGVRHIIGQRGRGHTGSLIELRMTAAGGRLAPRELIAGGFRPGGCVLDGRPRGCNRFAIARMAADHAGGLHLVWGYSEASLGGKCETDRGYCDNDLYYAVSRDDGRSWRNASGDKLVELARGRSLAHDDPAFRVADGHIGLFKAVAANGAGPLLVYSVVRGDRSDLFAARLTGTRWKRSVVARSGDAGIASWKGSLVLRRNREGWTLWTGTGDRIFRFYSRDGDAWKRSVAYRGPAWSVTGRPASAPGRQLLLWRGRREHGHSQVMAGLMRTGP